MDYDVSCVIPRWGRTFVRIMEKLAECSDQRDEIRQVIQIVETGKRSGLRDPHAAREAVDRIACPYVALAPDRKRAERYYRVGFLGMNIRVGDVVVRVEGDEPHNGTSLIRLDEADLAIVGLDELLAMCQHLLRNPSRVTKWGLFNYNLTADTDLRIAGSANLTSYNDVAKRELADFVGFFLISNQGLERADFDFQWLATHRMPVFVKGRYRDLIHKLFPGMNTVAVENVEDAVLGSGQGVGIEIIQSGSTVTKKGLRVWGSPLFISESVYVAHYHHYLQKPKLQELLQVLRPRGYFEAERIGQYVDWFKALQENLGDAWLNRPTPDSLFCSVREMRQGLRPYRLKTRRWVASDQYKKEEAEALVSDSLATIRSLYA